MILHTIDTLEPPSVRFRPENIEDNLAPFYLQEERNLAGDFVTTYKFTGILTSQTPIRQQAHTRYSNKSSGPMYIHISADVHTGITGISVLSSSGMRPSISCKLFTF